MSRDKENIAPSLPKTHGKGTIVFLIGTPGTGKSTICEALLSNDKALGRRFWVVFGQDQLIEKLGFTKLQGHDAVKSVGGVYNFFNIIFQEAIDNSKAGKPTILDMVIQDGLDLVSLFNKYMQAQNFSCPVHIAVAYCNLPTTIKHNADRDFKNNQAVIKKHKLTQEHLVTEASIKKNMCGYTIGYNFSDSLIHGKKIIENTTTKQVVDNIINLFGHVSRYRTQFQDKILQLSGNNNPSQQLFITINHKHMSPNFDTIYETDNQCTGEEKDSAPGVVNLQASRIEGIVKALNNLATDCSMVPAKPHPLASLCMNAGIIKQDRSRGLG